MSAVRSGAPLERQVRRRLLLASAPAAIGHASAPDRAHTGGRTRRKDAPAWARRQVVGRRLTDLGAVLIATTVAVAVSLVFGIRREAPGAANLTVAAIFAATWYLSLRLHKGSDYRSVGRGAQLGRAFVSTLLAFGLLAAANGFSAIDGFHAYLIAGMPIGILLLVATRIMWQRRLDAHRSVGLSLPRAVIVGSGPDIDFLAEQLGRAADPQYLVVGVAFAEGLSSSAATTTTGFPAFHGIDGVMEALSVTNADVVILAGQPGDGGTFVRALAWALENSSAELMLAWCLASVDSPRLTFETANGMPLIHVAAPSYSGGKHHIKRVMDVVLAGAALLALLPVFAVIALLIRRDSKGPVFFRQERVGLEGSTFEMIKFRSMVVTAEADLAALVDQSDGNGVLFKLRADPRVTRIGAILRRYSLDELPQIWNIFRGDMSLVGPRPPLAREVALYDDAAHRRLYIKPGLTGAWQVSGRSDLSWDESVRLDLHYVENWSAFGDIRIMWRTVGVILKPVGAY